METKFYQFLLLAFILCTNFTCYQKESDSCHRVNIVNNSDIYIYIYSSSMFPDTNTYYGYQGFLANKTTTKCFPHKSNNSAVTQNCIESNFGSFSNGYKPIPSDTLIVFIFDAYEIEVNKKDTVMQYYYVSLPDLQRLNFTLSFPPSEAMKDIKMYPPYKE